MKSIRSQSSSAELRFSRGQFVDARRKKLKSKLEAGRFVTVSHFDLTSVSYQKQIYGLLFLRR